MKIYVYLFIVVFIFSSLNAQEKNDSSLFKINARFGIRLEITQVNEERTVGLSHKPRYESGFNSYSYVFPFSIYLPLKINIDPKWSIGIRPGILFAGEHLTSFDIGIHGYFYPFKNRFYTLFGLENTKHINPTTFNATDELWNTYYQKITAHNDDEWHTAFIIGAGYELGKVVSVDLSMTLPFQQQYGWHDVKDQYNTIDLPDGRYPMKLFYMIKFGVNILIF